MKKYLILCLFLVICCTGCRKEKSISDTYIDKNVDSQSLLQNLDDYIEYKGNIKDEKNLNVTFKFKNGVKVPEKPPVVTAKVYLWMNDDFVGIYYRDVYNKYEDYLDSVKITVDAEGKKFNRYTVSFEGSIE